MTQKRFFRALALLPVLIVLLSGGAQARPMEIEHGEVGQNGGQQIGVGKETEQTGDLFRIIDVQDTGIGQINETKSSMIGMLQSMSKLAGQAAGGGLTDEITRLGAEIERVSQSTDFNSAQPLSQDGVAGSVSDGWLVGGDAKPFGLTGFVLGDGAMALTTSLGEDGDVQFGQLAGRGDAIYGSTNARAAMVDWHGNAIALGVGMGKFVAYNGWGNVLGWMDFESDGLSLIITNVTLNITLDGEPQESLTLNVGDTVTLGVEADRTRGSYSIGDPLYGDGSRIRLPWGGWYSRSVGINDTANTGSSTNVLVSAELAMLAQQKSLEQGVMTLLQ